MKYDYFMGMVKQYETDRIKAFPGKSSTATENIPRPFALLMQNVIGILNENIAALCQANENLIIMGLQPAGQMIQSPRAQHLNRCIDRNYPTKHLCCTLDYLVINNNDAAEPFEWQETSTVVIDFTIGDVMDEWAYLKRLCLSREEGQIYGGIKADLLQTAWQIYNFRQIKQNNLRKFPRLGLSILKLAS